MTARSFSRRTTLYILGSFAALILLPLWLWAVRAPDPAYAPLPDYDIRWGYAAGTTFNHPGIAEEAALLRQQRGAKGVVGGAERQAVRAGDAAGVAAAFGAEAKVEWGPSGAPRMLRREAGALAAPQPGSEPQTVAREFLRSHPALFGLSEAAVEALTVAREISSPRARHVTFRQTVDGVPVYGADYKVSLTVDNAVLSAGGRLFPDLRVAGEAKFTAVEATQAAARYVGSLLSKPAPAGRTRPSPAATSLPTGGWGKVFVEDSGEFNPIVLSSESGPEQKTTLAAEPLRREVLARRVVFPLTATLGRPAWQVYLLKRPTEYYEIVVDAEDGALLARTNLVKFIVWAPQGLVFERHPDFALQVTQSFIGDATASPNTFVDSTQSTHQGNNAFPLLGGNDQTGAGNFSFSFTNSYLTSGATSFNLDTNKTIQFTPNGNGGYDMTFPAFTAPAANNELLPLSDDSAICGAAPAGFVYFGSSVSTVCVGSNGFVTMGSGSTFYEENVADMINGLPRIMGFWDDLNPSAGGTVGVSYDTLPTPSFLCARWTNVPEFGVGNANNFSICGYGTGNPLGLPAGTIRLSYPTAGVAAADGLVGITPRRMLFNSSTGDSKNTTIFTTFTNPESTIGPIGFARQFPSHNDVAAGATNIFWHLNQTGHDRLYAAGFTETADNMQNDNFGRGGLENDPIEIWYSGSTNDPIGGTNNAFFAPSPEGTCCPFTDFLLFTNPPFRRVDSAFDSDVIVHEHGHGVSWRLVGSLDSQQSGAMGEGWSDFLALSYSGDPVMGEYVTGNSSTGIRNVRYDSSSPRELGQYANIFGPITFTGGTGTVFFPEVHDDGEIWASLLADLRTGLLGDGMSNDDVEEVVLDGMAGSPPDPTMLEARDALLTAATNAGGSACTAWTAFAGRGFGQNADANDTPLDNLGNLSMFSAFDRPGACGGTFSDTATPIHTANFDSAVVGALKADGWKGQKRTFWHVTNRRSTTGAQSFWFGREITGTYEKGTKRKQGTLTSPILNLSAATRPVLEFDLFVATEQFFPVDTLWLRVSTNGGGTYPIQRAILFWGTSGAFTRIRVDLTPLAGQSQARLQFYFDTVDGIANAFEGVYIDNVVVRNYTEN
jgi:hypothetical protein